MHHTTLTITLPLSEDRVLVAAAKKGSDKSTTCTACGYGTYQDTTGQDHCETCQPCIAGKYRIGCADDHEGTCPDCNRGSYKTAELLHDSTCTDCTPGKYGSAHPDRSTPQHCARQFEHPELGPVRRSPHSHGVVLGR